MKVFRVKFKCEECTYEWEESFDRGDRVTEQTSYSLYSGPCGADIVPHLSGTRLISNDKKDDYDQVRFIRCPNCDGRNPKIVGRIFIEGMAKP